VHKVERRGAATGDGAAEASDSMAVEA